ncbi:CRISPR-associated protein Csx10 [Acetivibrio thermocellus AD2]|jgi:CRISPR/Cas system CSM-associated protein Csm3 (group 7 of RAMP superfamily)|uniref:CRISPR-associated protein Csx10 n=1 Tax=Acetivibrio thermocellus AD2 TaxID=1138384 RepID=A0AB36TGR4_ACETH|nr:RAMP superfamily CRISPR-associated protein [Acetivibrio thermocellus]ADU73834.1 protein of unknown function DUF324 [Acetivibrio thermocellus DSM 1313]ALX07767.1 protein of unknown function DUF324 [Acetivibrio thermocellus AD2]ANV75509.1 protein of unknown function DUF324 [Acetivibrio thermocellus DSM 2360]EIC05725.1 protein of unknown function DUF324 [Acetivibrio thermocellus YS]PFH02035.1 CRISPR-associated protein Csx10 [Acetivibrio thermocellus AD2]
MSGLYRIEMELLSEAIFGSGYSIPGSVDLEIVCDEYGIPFMKAKTFKGNLREVMEDAAKLLGKGYEEKVEQLLGKENSGVDSWKNLKFSDCRLQENVREYIRLAIETNKITAAEVKEAMTSIRSFTSIDDNGSSKKGSLREYRVIKKGLVFEVDVECERELSEEELALLAVSVKSLRYIGMMRTRGKGRVSCRLLVKENEKYKDVTDFYVNKLLEGARANV